MLRVLTIIINCFVWIFIICAVGFVLMLLINLIMHLVSKKKMHSWKNDFDKTCQKENKHATSVRPSTQSEQSDDKNIRVINDSSIPNENSQEYKDDVNVAEPNYKLDIAHILKIGKNAVDSANLAVEKSRNESHFIELNETDYEKHKGDTYYKLKSNVMSKGEMLLLDFLEKIIDPNKYVIIPQVHYDRYLEVNKDRDEIYQAISASKINKSSTDFGIETIAHTPICYIEYNDDTHKREDRQLRDNFLFNACKKAGLPLIVITSREINSQIIENKSTAKICKFLYKKLYNRGNPLCYPSLTCPKCGKEFKLFVGDYGAFLSHGRNNNCENINIFRK